MKRKVIATCLALSMAMSTFGFGINAAAEEPVEISFWHSMDGVPGEIVQKQIDAFNSTVGAEKNIHVTGVFQDWPGTDALNAAMATDDVDNMPDVIQMYSEYVDLIRDWERTAWVEDFITAEGAEVTKEDLIANMVSAYSLNGKMIGAPYAISTLVLYYNKDLLAQAGYDKAPETIAEMAEMITAIMENTDADYGLNVRVNQFEFENFIATQGENGTYFGNNESGRSDNMTELACLTEIDNFLTEWEKVIATGGFKATKDSMNEEFAQGLNAMVLMTSSRIPTIAELVGDSFEWSVAAAPKVNATDIGGGYPSGSGLFMVNRDDEAKLQAAWEFTQYMISADAQAMWLDGYSYVPVNTNTLETDAYKAAVEADPRLQVPYDILVNSPANVVASFCPASGEVDTIIKDAMISFAEGTSKDDTYAAITDGIGSAFEAYFRANPVD